MSALDNTFLKDSLTQPMTDGFNGPLKRSPKFIIKNPLQTMNTRIVPGKEPQTIENRSILTTHIVQK